MTRTIPPRTFACGVFVEGENHRVGLEGVLVEQDGEVRVASVRNKLIGDVADVITGFLKTNRMKPPASRCDFFGGYPARWARVPPTNRETVLMMHEVIVAASMCPSPSGLTWPNWTMERTRPEALEKVHVPHEGLHRGTCTPFVGS